MATIGNTYIGLADLYKSKDLHGNLVDVIEMLDELNPMLSDMLVVECNSGTQHLTTVRGGLPNVAWGKLYKGIANSKSTRVQVTDTTGYLEGISSVDTRLLELAGDGANYLRMSEAQGFLASLSNEMQSALFYSNDAETPEQFLGLAPRFNDPTAPNGGQIINGGGSGSDNTSIWMVGWGENACHGLYPKGTAAGIKREDKGEQRVSDDNNQPYYVKEELFRWHMGASVRDWRYVVRIANIDVSAMQAGSVALYDLLRQAYYKFEARRNKKKDSNSGSNPATVRPAIYCNSDVMQALDALATNAGASDNFVRLKPMEIAGEEVLTYRGIPIREVDALLNTEELVPFA